MNERVERRIGAFEYTKWKQPALNKFVEQVFSSFVQEFVPKNSEYCYYLQQDFNQKLKNLASNRKDYASIWLPPDLTFTFCDYFPKYIYRNEFDNLFNFDCAEVELPLQNNIFLHVRVDRFLGDTKVFGRIVNFFSELEDERNPIDRVLSTSEIKGKNYFGEVYAFITPEAFKGGIRRIPVQDIAPSKQWVKKLMEEFLAR